MMILFIFLMSFFVTTSALPLSEQPSTLKIEKNGQLGKELLYTRAIQSYPSIDADPTLYDELLGDLKKLSSKMITEKQFTEFAESVKKMFEDGICYGGAVSFLLSSAESTDSTITLPFTKEDKIRALQFQALVKLQVIFKREYEKGFFHSNKAMQWCDFYKALEKRKIKQLDAAGLHSLGIVKIQKGPECSDLAVSLVNAIAHLMEEKNATDVIICFDTTINEKRVGHAVLVQLGHKRIYDGGLGIYQYTSLSDLLQDLIKYVSMGSTYFDLEAFGLKEVPG